MWMPGLSASPLKMYARRSGIRLAKIDHSNDHRADRPRILEAARGVLGFIAGWLVGPYAAAGPLAENGRKNDAGISAQWRLSYLSAADFGASSSV